MNYRIYLIRKIIFFIILLVLINCSSSDKDMPIISIDRVNYYLDKILSFGPRVPNTKNHDKAKRFITKMLDSLNVKYKLQEFVGIVEHKNNLELYLSNIIISLSPDKKERVLLSAHWDSRPWADKDPVDSLRNRPVLGANDSAAEIALLLAVIETYVHSPSMNYGLDVIFFDGEDYGDYSSRTDWCLGSKYFAANIKNYHPEYSILLDMIADKELIIKKDRSSLVNAGDMVNRIWKIAKKLNINAYSDETYNFSIYDDHVPLNKAGIRTIDLIDFDYKFWHTTKDIKENISIPNLMKTGKIIMYLLYGGTI